MQSKGGNKPDCLLEIVSWKNAALLARRLGRSTHVQVAQVTQRRFVLCTHATRKIRIIQMLVARRLWHVLQHAEPLLNRALPVRRKLSPPRQHIIFDVIPLLRRQFLPRLRPVAHLLLLLRRKPVELLLVSLPFLGSRGPRRRGVRIQWTIQVIRAARGLDLARRVRLRGTVRVPLCLSLRLLPLLLRGLRVRLLLILPLFRRTILLPIRSPALRKSGRSQRRANP